MVAREAHNLEVGGSIPPPTTQLWLMVAPRETRTIRFALRVPKAKQTLNERGRKRSGQGHGFSTWTTTNYRSLTMLVLTRRTDERILVGENIVVEVLEVRGGNVRIGIKAPRNVRIDREELRMRRDIRDEPF